MCFMKPPKIEMPEPAKVVPPPPPLTETLQGVELGGDTSEPSGRKQLKIKKDNTTKNRMASKQTRGVIKRNSAVDNKSS